MDDAEYFEMATETSYYQIELEGNNSPDIDFSIMLIPTDHTFDPRI